MNALPIGLPHYTGDGLTREQRDFDAACDARDAAIHANPDEFATYVRRFVESSEPVTLRDDNGHFASVRPEELFHAWFQQQVEKECQR